MPLKKIFRLFSEGDPDKDKNQAPENISPEDRERLYLESLGVQLVSGLPEKRKSALTALAAHEGDLTPVIPAIVSANLDADPELRRQAALVLDRLGPNWPALPAAETALPILIQKLGSGTPEIARGAFLLLQRFGRAAVPAMIPVISDGSQSNRQLLAVQLLARLGPDAASAVPTLLEQLPCGNTLVYAAILQTLAKLDQGESVMAALIDALGNESQSVRKAAALALETWGPAAEPALPKLIGLLADKQEEVRMAAVNALAGTGAIAAPYLLKILDTDEAAGGRKVMENLQHLLESIQPNYYRWKEDFLNNMSWQVLRIAEDHRLVSTMQEAALQVLAQINAESESEALLPVMQSMLQSERARLRLLTLKVLGNLGEAVQPALPAVMLQLQDHNGTVRKAALEALQQINADWHQMAEAQAFLPQLVDGLRDQAAYKEAALDALRLIGRPALPYLMDGLTTGDRVIREETAHLIGALGSAAGTAIPALRERVVRDDNRWVREAALAAIERIEAG